MVCLTSCGSQGLPVYTVGARGWHPDRGLSPTAIRPWSAAESSVTTGYARFFSSISVQSFAPRPLPSIEDT